MADEKKQRDGNIKAGRDHTQQADQAEGERHRTTSTKVKGPPDQAEGDRDTIEQDIREKERQGKL